jgi:hypothetical protein
MKRTIILILLSILASIFLLISFFFINHVINFKYEEEPFDKYLYYLDNSKIKSILKKLNYNAGRKYFNYKKDKYKIIFKEIPIDKYLNNKSLKNEFKKIKEWVSEGKRLIVFYNYLDNTDDFVYPEESDFDVVKVKSNDQFLDQIDSLYINQKSDLGKFNKNIFTNKINPILKVEDRIIIALEKYNNGQIIYISDYFIFSDKSILKEDNAMLLNNLLKDYFKEKIAFDRVFEMPKIEQKKSFIFMNNFPFLFMQIIIISLIFFLTFFKRFGQALDFDKYKKRSIINHLISVGNFFQKSRTFQSIVRIFDQYFFERIQNIIKFKSINDQNMLNNISKRFNLTAEEKELFIKDNIPKIFEIQKRREIFIRKLKKGEYKQK